MSQKSQPKYVCSQCDYYTSKDSEYEKHILTRKHKILTNDLQKVAKNTQPKYVCIKCNLNWTYHHKPYKMLKSIFINPYNSNVLKLSIQKMNNFEKKLSF